MTTTRAVPSSVTAASSLLFLLSALAACTAVVFFGGVLGGAPWALVLCVGSFLIAVVGFVCAANLRRGTRWARNAAVVIAILTVFVTRGDGFLPWLAGVLALGVPRALQRLNPSTP
ncbi:hypothetical protein [Allokutzneria sp. NRRL B-24872]|uniref:hypothetical protein n=1 Tax=Allokutzneria sp. NRRL B-24872 TaxID=1137961 RepID=UPI0011784B9F|nr:hypothetical protein [Allokutzneria sp. NRRL B-24872]